MKAEHSTSTVDELVLQLTVRLAYLSSQWATIITAHVGVLPLADLFYSHFQLFKLPKAGPGVEMEAYRATKLSVHRSIDHQLGPFVHGL
jgi:hypothetical protein